jgi:hypothetical protein
VSYPTSYESTRQRYAAFLSNIADNGLPVAAATNCSQRMPVARGWRVPSRPVVSAE